MSVSTHRHLCIVKREVILKLAADAKGENYSVSFLPEALKESTRVISTTTVVPLFSGKNGDLMMVVDVETKDE